MQLKKNEQRQFIKGPAGKLESITSTPLHLQRDSIAILCHPHPLHQGTMHNKIVTTLVRAFNETGVAAIRFNFRGVGESEGSYDNGEGETEDALAVIDWANAQYPDFSICYAGFSFGAYVAAKTATERPPQLLITIAPPVKADYTTELEKITCPWLIVQGEKDEVIDPESVIDWAKTRDPKPDIIIFPETGHFFHGQLITLQKTLVTFLAQHL